MECRQCYCLFRHASWLWIFQFGFVNQGCVFFNLDLSQWSVDNGSQLIPWNISLAHRVFNRDCVHEWQSFDDSLFTIEFRLSNKTFAPLTPCYSTLLYLKLETSAFFCSHSHIHSDIYIYFHIVSSACWQSSFCLYPIFVTQTRLRDSAASNDRHLRNSLMDNAASKFFSYTPSGPSVDSNDNDTVWIADNAVNFAVLSAPRI